jgi:chromosome segregation ATPase
MDAVSIQWSVLVSLGSALLTIGTVYGIITSKLSAMRKEADEAKEDLAKVARDLNIAEKDIIRLQGESLALKSSLQERDGALEELKASAVTRGVFEAWMQGQNQTLDQQNRALDHIVKRIDGGARTLSQQVRTTESRVEIDSERPYDPGPMRPKLPSRRG